MVSVNVLKKYKIALFRSEIPKSIDMENVQRLSFCEGVKPQAIGGRKISILLKKNKNNI